MKRSHRAVALSCSSCLLETSNEEISTFYFECHDLSTSGAWDPNQEQLIHIRWRNMWRAQRRSHLSANRQPTHQVPFRSLTWIWFPFKSLTWIWEVLVFFGSRNRKHFWLYREKTRINSSQSFLKLLIQLDFFLKRTNQDLNWSIHFQSSSWKSLSTPSDDRSVIYTWVTITFEC